MLNAVVREAETPCCLLWLQASRLRALGVSWVVSVSRSKWAGAWSRASIDEDPILFGKHEEGSSETTEGRRGRRHSVIKLDALTPAVQCTRRGLRERRLAVLGAVYMVTLLSHSPLSWAGVLRARRGQTDRDPPHAASACGATSQHE